jgi:hypothetical protein
MGHLPPRQRQSATKTFLDVLTTRGTVLFSWLNVAEIATTSNDTGTRIKSFLDDLGKQWLPLEVNPDVVPHKEEGWTRGDPTPCLDESFIKEYYPHIHEGPLHLGKIVDLVDGEGDGAKARLHSLKQTVLETVNRVREKETTEPGWAAKAFPSEGFDPSKPTRFIYNALFREMATKKGWTLEPNDGVDLFHCIVTAAYSDIVLLDKAWTNRVRALNLPPSRVRAYYEGDLDEFFETFANGRIQSRPR